MCDSGTDATVTVKGVAHAVTVGGEVLGAAQRGAGTNAGR